ncbi:MAG TPA: tetratricopeptide repeat protein [Terriglobia bacterium]|nr:tetratricopeptide repeat protein [Terriglobia bacterium]
MGRGRSLTALTLTLLIVLAAPLLRAEGEAAGEILARGRQVYTEQGPESGLPLFEQALDLYREASDRRGEAIVLGYIGNCHKRLGDLPLALDYLNKALTIKRELGDKLEEGKTLSHLGLVYWEMGDYQRAIDHLTRSISLARELGDRQLEGAALNNLSLVYDEQGDYQRSLEQYQHALDLHRATGFSEGESATLGNIGGVYLFLGRFREAMRYYQQALAISQRLNLKPSASQDLGNLALCHLGLGQVKEALSTFDRALTLAHEAGLKKEEADWRKGKGEALFHVGKYNAAMEEYDRALRVYEQAGLKRELVEALNDLGALQMLLGDATSAEKEFRRAVELARALGNPRGVTLNLLALGNLEWRRKRYEEAAALYSQALARAREADDRAQMAASLVQLALTYPELNRYDEAIREGEDALQIAREQETRLAEAEALYALGEAERRRGRLDAALERYETGEEIVQSLGDPELGWRLAYAHGLALEQADRPEDAVAAYKRAVGIIEAVRSQLLEERYRAGYIEDKFQVYVALVRLLLKLDRPREAFLFSEKLRARSYLDLLNHASAPVLDPARQEEENELRARIRRLERAIKEETTKPSPEQRRQALDLFSTELVAAERSYQNLLDDLRRSQPQYAAAHALEIPSSEAVQESLPAGTGIIEYVIEEQGVAVFVVTGQALRATTVPIRAVDLESKVSLLRDLILNVDSDAWVKPAESLRQTLIDPLEEAGWLEGLSKLYVVPHGVLHYLPLAILPHPSAGGRHFLMEDFAVSYLPAAAALVNGARSEDPENSLFALAPARARLRFAQSEAQSISEYFQARRLVLLGARATEGAFKRQADRYSVIHLATHGFFNRLNPLLSGVELEPDQDEDGRLEVHEILGLRLHARLVTLSACDTALASGYFAEVPAGDDFVGLTRAFLYAGSPSVLASLWEVNDRSTPRLMRSFYSHLAKTDKATALVEAQRALVREGGRFSHPYFWGPFVLVGMMN